MIRLLDDGFEVDDDPARVDIDVVHRFIAQESYWAPGRPRERQQELHDAARRVVGAYGPAGQVGYARAVSDGTSFAYLADVFVLPAARGRGLGVEIVREMVENGPLAAVRWMLNTGDAHGLYARFGFAEPRHAVMERRAAGAR